MMNFPLRVSILFAIVVATACGGDSGGSTPAVSQRSHVTVTSSVALEVVANSLEAMSFSALMGDLSGPGVLRARPGIRELNKTPVYLFLNPDGFSDVPMLAQVGPIRQQCGVAGTMTVTGDMLFPALGLSAGDALCMVFEGCDQGEGLIIDGVMDALITSCQGSIHTDQFSLGVSVVVTNLVLADEVQTIAVNGEFNVLTDTMLTPIVETRINGGSMAWVDVASSLLLEDFSNELTANGGSYPMAYEMTARGAVSGSRYEGVAEYQTVRAFAWYGDGYFQEGEMVITGDHSSILVIALDVNTVRLEMDYDGDGAADEIRDLSWDEVIG